MPLVAVERWSRKGESTLLKVRPRDGWTVEGVDLLEHGEILPEDYTDE